MSEQNDRYIAGVPCWVDLSTPDPDAAVAFYSGLFGWECEDVMPEGAPVNPYASGIPKTAAHPNAAKLFLNWCMSVEGQTFMIKEQGNLTSLKEAPVYPEGFDPKVVKVWYPDFDQYVKLHGAWVADWDKTFGYRQ